MDNHTGIFGLISKLATLNGVEINLQYYGDIIDNSNRKELFHYTKTALLELYERYSYYEYLTEKANVLFLDLEKIHVKYKNFEFEIKPSDNCSSYGFIEIVYFDSTLLAKNTSYGVNENDADDKRIYRYQPVSIDIDSLVYDESDCLELINLLSIKGIDDYNKFLCIWYL